MDKLLKIAINQIDDMQRSRIEHNNTIIDYAEKVGVEWLDNSQTPWCSIFLNWCAQQAGLTGSGKANTRSWLLVGWPTFNPEPGDVAVCWDVHPESENGYVGVYVGCSKNGKHIYCVGGNEYGGVSLSTYPLDKLLGFQRLVYAKEPLLPEVDLKKGDDGQDVKELQNLLKMAGFECGLSDGKYGVLTDAAVSALKTANGVLNPTGIYDKTARECLMVC